MSNMLITALSQLVVVVVVVRESDSWRQRSRNTLNEVTRLCVIGVSQSIGSRSANIPEQGKKHEGEKMS